MSISSSRLHFRRSELLLFLLPLLVLVFLGVFSIYDKSAGARAARTQRLIEAASRNDTSSIIRLSSKGADPNVRDKNGKSALSWAISHSNAVATAALLNAGANPNDKGEAGLPLLYHAVTESRNAKLVQILLDKGANPHFEVPALPQGQKFPEPLLIRAIRSGSDHQLQDASIVTLLLEKGLPLNDRDKNGNTPLSVAAFLDYVPAVETLLSFGADPNMPGRYGRTPLMLAVARDTGCGRPNRAHVAGVLCPHRKIVEMLIANGANVNARNRLEYGETALMGAARNGDPATIQLLLDNGADLKAITKDGDTVLMFAIPQGYVDNVRVLLDNGVDVNALNKYGQTALITVNSQILGAENKHRLAIARLLIGKGAKVNIKDKDRETALDYALDFAEDEEMGQLLRSAGARRGKP